jgi:hypothetical protein
MPIQTTYNYFRQYAIAGQDEASFTSFDFTTIVASVSQPIFPGTAVEGVFSQNNEPNVPTERPNRAIDTVVQRPGSGLVGAAFVGISVYDRTDEVFGKSIPFHTQVTDPNLIRPIEAQRTIRVRNMGDIWVRVDAVITTLNPISTVYYIPTGVNAGVFTTVAAGNTAVPQAQFVSPSFTDLNGQQIAKLRLNYR